MDCPRVGIVRLGEALSDKQPLLWIGAPHAPPPNVCTAVQSFDLRVAIPQQSLQQQLYDVPVALVYPNDASRDLKRLNSLLNELDNSNVVALFLLPPDAPEAWQTVAGRGGRFICIDSQAGSDELAAKVAAAAALQPAFKTLRQELGVIRDMNQGSAKLIEELDEEMRLAARLQRDFLPRRLPEVGPTRFGVLYRPATWVSGDIYDVARLDETHVGFYVADAVGHGMPAALLTMFIKKALQTKRIVGTQYQIIPPHISLGELNIDICQQNLSSCQFCTAVYCVLDTQTLQLTYARAGHPEPILLRREGQMQRLSARGSLLGVFPEEQFEMVALQLAPGDRLVLYTDGAEDALRTEEDPRDKPLEKLLGPLLHRRRDELLLNVASRLDALAGQTPVEDDVTLLVMDIDG